MYFGAASRRACGRAVAAGARAGAPAWLTSASGYSRRSERIGVPITRMRVCLRACVATFHGCGAFDRTSAHCCTAGAGARARGARQVHPLHEGEGAPRVARPVQALGATVRPPPPPPPPCAFAAVRALRRCACAAAPGAGPHRAASDAAAAVLPVVGRRPSPRAHGWHPRPTGAREGVGPSRPARPHRLARRSASNTELAALPAAADWPNLKTL